MAHHFRDEDDRYDDEDDFDDEDDGEEVPGEPVPFFAREASIGLLQPAASSEQPHDAADTAPGVELRNQNLTLTTLARPLPPV